MREYRNQNKKEVKKTNDTTVNKVVQLMACTLQSYNYKEIEKLFIHYGLTKQNIDKELNTLRQKGYISGYISPFYLLYKVQANIEKWHMVARSINPDEVDDFFDTSLKITKQPNSKPVKQFVKAYINYTHGLPFDINININDWSIIQENQVLVESILEKMFSNADDYAFLKHLDANFLHQRYFNLFLYNWIGMSPTGDNELLRTVFLENELLPEKKRVQFNNEFLFYHEFLATGRLDDIMGRISSDSKYYTLLNCIKMMHVGDYSTPYDTFSSILNSENSKVFHSALCNLAYAICLGTKNSPQAKKTAAQLIKSRLTKNNSSCYPMLLALHHFFVGDVDDFLVKHPVSSCGNILGRILSILFIKHYSIPFDDKSLVLSCLRWIEMCHYDYLRLLFTFDFNEMSKYSVSLKDTTGMKTSLLPTKEKQQRWEQVIDLLMMRSSSSVTQKQTAQEMSRLAYMVETKRLQIQPKVQKSKDGGITWSKGRNASLKNFQLGNVEGMTQQDYRVAKAVEQYYSGWSYNIVYELCGPKAIAALVGNPNVFSETSGQHLDIVEEPLQLTVQQTTSGFSITSNVDLAKITDHYIIEPIGNKQLTVIHVSEAQEKTLRLLYEVKTFPKESKKRLTELLKGLSSDFTVMSPLLKNSTELKHIEADSLISVQIAPADSMTYIVTLAVKPFGSHPPYQRPGKGMEIVSTTIDGERVQTERDLKAEKQHLDTLLGRMSSFDDDMTDENEWSLDTAQCLQLLEQLRTATDICYVEWPQGVKMRVVRPMINADQLSLKISSAGQWFEVEGDVKIDEKEKLKIAQLLELLRSNTGNFIRLNDDEYVALNEQLRRQLQAIDKMLIGRGKGLKVATMNGMQLSALEDIGVKVKADDTFRKLMQRIDEADKIHYELPANIHAELRNYQVEGYQWMSRLAHWGAGACLADDMGLGKTIQAITLMLSRASHGPQLVIMPTSLLLNWQSELKRFAPTLNVHMINPQGANRQQIVHDADATDIVLATYGLLVTEGELLAQRTWTTIVLDEAHSIKNRETQTSKAAMQLQGDFRLMLTGTPLQNHLNEIWNLFQFANPGLLGSYQQFTERFILPVERDHDQERQRLLRRLLSPFMLRRTKDDVLNELPEKTEITISVELSSEEQALYDNMRRQAIANLETNAKSTLQTLAEITKLRQAACNPRLIDPKLPIKSSKAAAFLNLVGELRSGNHRSLVFSQFTSHLALIREELDKQEVPYLYLDGSTSPSERNRLVRLFQTGNDPLFLISLKAGGLGLNLTAADYVIHLDPWWNPAIEDQASDRAHRIGQKRPVTVYRLISAGTIEEKIIRLHQNKRSLADALLEDANLFTQLSSEEILHILQEEVTGEL